MIIKPDYYDNFKCTASSCKHNCCIGWEIDIDDETFEKYRKIKGELGKKLKNNITKKPYSHFKLTSEERCPFLNEDNLCELIIYGGEQLLCQICSDHPRFYNFVSDHIEEGIGLCCEQAARIILSKTEPVVLIAEGGKMPTDDFTELRADIFEIIQDRSYSLPQRIQKLIDFSKAEFPIDKKDWISIYKKLERLDDSWDKYLDSINNFKVQVPKELENAYEQLIVYFLYRHLPEALNDGLITERIQFAILSFCVIKNIANVSSLEELIEIARMYSSEIEYSDQNVEKLLEELRECNEISKRNPS
jgi:lysine-N-methylase